MNRQPNTNQLRTPLIDLLDKVIQLEANILARMNAIFDNYTEEEAKPYFIQLSKEGDRLTLLYKAIQDRLKAQKHFDLVYVNPDYKSSYNPRHY